MTDITEATTEAEAVSVLAKLADANVPATFFKIDGNRDFAVNRNDFTLKEVTLPNAADVLMPKIVTQTPNLQTVSSMISYVNRFKNDDTVIFADIKNNRVIAVIDYHKAPGKNPDDTVIEPRARLGTHSAILHLPFSQEWDTWMGTNERLMKHVEFASFLEENAFDVAKPAGADLLELCRDLQVKQDSHFHSSIRMGDTASISFSKDEDATTKDNMVLPVSFELSIPVYFGEANIPLLAFMRRKIGDGTLHLGYKLSRHEQARQREFNRIVSEIEDGTGVTTIYGTR